MSLTNPRIIAEYRALRHYERERVSDLSGTNHGIVNLRHPKQGPFLVACLCGKTFWVSPKIKSEVPVPEDYETHEEYVRVFRSFLGVEVSDVSERKARKVRGSSKKKGKRKWFR